ncbi:dermonecrotic toxin domain-containing protein, partial [Pseudomonas sp.]|uniref:dermonecrotic toxin domain-containing protein n=1 Tax=Pseudomonas sp. TaxID=306 RepID=UPI002ED9E6F8
MPSAHSIYFQSASLRQRYIAELQAALLAATLCTEEHDWLLCLVRDDAEPDTEAVRVDHLVFDDGRNTPLDMAAALLLSHPTSGSPTVYLHTLAQGVESFADRAALLAVLRERFADNDSQSAFEYERLEGDPFRAQMIKIVDSQAERVEQMTEALSTTPTLFSAASAALSEPLQRSLPDRVLNPTVNLLQIVQTASGDSPEKVLMTQTLAQAAYDDFCKRGLIDGVDRRFLDAQGRVLPPADAARLARAITEAVAATGERFDALLKDFWADGWRGQRTRRDQAIDTFDSSFRHAVYRSHQQGEMTSLEWTALRSWLHEMRAPLSKRSGIRCSRLVITAEDGTRTGLAGTFVLHLTQSADDALWWFSPDHVLRRFADVTALHVYLSSAEGRTQLRPALPLASRSAFDALDSTRPVLEDIEGQVYANRIESIIAWQASNLAYVCTLSCDADQVSAMFDDALDVRQLLDPWQLQFSAGRWREQAPFDFLSVWRLDGDGSAVQAGVSAAEQEDALDHVGHKMGETAFRASARAMLTPSWREQMNVADRLAGELHELNHGLRDHARLALQRYLCVAD